jgi:hypothetical protein
VTSAPPPFALDAFQLDAIRAERRDWIAAGEAVLVTIAKTNFGLR